MSPESDAPKSPARGAECRRSRHDFLPLGEEMNAQVGASVTVTADTWYQDLAMGWDYSFGGGGGSYPDNGGGGGGVAGGGGGGNPQSSADKKEIGLRTSMASFGKDFLVATMPFGVVAVASQALNNNWSDDTETSLFAAGTAVGIAKLKGNKRILEKATANGLRSVAGKALAKSIAKGIGKMIPAVGWGLLAYDIGMAGYQAALQYQQCMNQ